MLELSIELFLDPVSSWNVTVFFSLDETLGDYYYFNFETGETQWNHPLDKIFREKVIQARLTYPNEGVPSQDINIHDTSTDNIKVKAWKGGATETIVNTDVHETNDKGLICNTTKQDDQEMSLTPKKLVRKFILY